MWILVCHVCAQGNGLSNGQACFWFSNGCDIGSGTCDGDTGQILDRNHFIYVGNGTVPSWGKEGIVPDPKLKGKSAGYHYREPAFRPKNLKYPERNATLPCELRTLNTGSECGGPEDFWYYAVRQNASHVDVLQVSDCDSLTEQLAGCARV